MAKHHGSTRALSDRELKQLLSRRLIASLATLDARERIHVVPMWFLLRDDSLLFPTSSGTRKVKNIRHAPIATAMIHEASGGPNVRGAMITGRIDVVTGDEATKLNRRIHLRYMTAEGMVQPDVVELLRHDDVTLRLTIADIVSWKLKAGQSPNPVWSRPLA